MERKTASELVVGDIYWSNKYSGRVKVMAIEKSVASGKLIFTLDEDRVEAMVGTKKVVLPQ